MKHVWQLQEAKNKFSEVVEEAINHGPQIITKRGEETVIIISLSEYRKMLVSQKKLSKFFSDSPLSGIELNLERDKSELRDEIS
jgi:antitoxin Phd